MSRRALGLVLLALTAAPAAAAQTVTVRPAGDLSSLVGVPFDMPIVADWSARADRLGSFAVTLRWDPAVLRFDVGVPGSFGTIEANNDSAAQGVLKLAGANPAGVTGMITLAVGRFTPLAAGTTPVTLQLGDIFSSSPDFTNLSGSTSVQSGLYCPARGHWGDPDGDGTVGSRDALIALSEAVGLDVSAFPEHGLADVDADATIKARDALIILSYAVGLDVSGFRVLRVAVGSCGSDATTTYAVTPTGQALVARGETQLHFELRATAGGAVRTLPDVFWRSSDPSVLAVLPDGRGVPIGPGTVVITGKSGQLDSATAVMSVVSRRSQHVVDALAISAVNRLGTPTYPYATLAEASAAAAEGDTVIVRPGRYDQPATFGVGVVILGQTVGAANVILAGADNFYRAALAFTGGARAEVHNVSALQVAIGIAAFGVDTLVVDSLRYEEGAGTCGDYAIVTGEIWRLEVRRSELRGGGTGGVRSSCAGGIGVTGAARLVLVEDLQASDFGDDAIFAPLVDSVVVRRSHIHDNYGYAVDVSASRYGSAVEVPLPTSMALLIEDSRFENNTYGGVYAGDLRGGRATRTVIDAPQGDGFYLVGTSGAADGFALVADTVRGLENYWLTSYLLDTLRIDSMQVVGTRDGYVDGISGLRVNRSRFDNVMNGTVLYVNGDASAAARIDIDSLTVNGDGGCTQCAEALQSYGAAVTVNHFSGDNLSNAIQIGDSAASVTNSTITNAYVGIYTYGPTFGVSAAPAVTIRGVTMADVVYGIESDYEALLADNVTLTRGYYGIQTSSGYVGPSGPDTVTNSTITDYAYALWLGDSVQVVTGNTIVRPRQYGMQISGYGAATDSTIVLNNTITCDAAGASYVEAIYGGSSNYRIETNDVQGCHAGVHIYGGYPANTATIRGNTFAAPGYYGGAVQINTPVRAEIVGNTSLSSGSNGAIMLNGYSYQHLGFARVDSNTIRGARERAIWSDYVDSLGMRGNVIDTVTSTGVYGGGAQGIALSGATDGSAVIAGNRIRGVRGTGIWIYQQGIATISVDSNGISGSDSAAIRVDAGNLAMRGNNIRNNPQIGLSVPSCCGPHEVHQNAFQGNGLYAAASTGDATINADSNWWGAPGGPGSPGADSTLGVFDNAPLAVEPLPLPPLSAPVPLLASLPRPTAAPTVTAVAAAPPAAPALVTTVVERSLRGVPAEIAARRAARPALAAPLAGLREQSSRGHEARRADAQVREDARVARLRAALDAEAARKAARRQP